MNRSLLFVFVILTASQFIELMQISMVAVALPDVIADLDAPLRLGSWVLTIFLLGLVIGQPVAARLYERFGGRATFGSALLVFSAASIAAGMSPSIYVLIGMRAIQGITAGIGMPVAIAIISAATGEKRARPIAILTALMPVSTVIGPTIGGGLVEIFDWRATLFFNPLLLVPLTVLAWWKLPVGERQPGRGFDFPGIALLAMSATALIYALSELGRRGGGTNYGIVAVGLLGGVTLAWLLWQRERRAVHPVINLGLLRRREFVIINITAFFLGLGLTGGFSVLPLYAQTAYGMSPAESGALISPRSGAIALGALLGAALLFRLGYRRLVLAAVWGTGAFFALLALGLHDPTIAGVTIPSFAWVVFVTTSLGFTTGLANPVMANAGLDLAPDQIPAISGLRAMAQSLGAAVGTAILFMISARAGSTTAGGLEVAFAAVAVMYICLTFLALQLPEASQRSVTREAQARRGATDAGGPSDASPT